MFEFLTEGFLWGVFWLAVGWNIPQPVWAKWAQEKGLDVYYWVKDKIRNR